MSEEHQHNWQAVPKWFGRYRCSDCRTFGFRKRVIVGFGATYQIVPYICEKQKCGQFVVRFRKNSKGKLCRFCDEHCQQYDARNGLSFDSQAEAAAIPKG